jgi:hypothetical protein
LFTPAWYRNHAGSASVVIRLAEKGGEGKSLLFVNKKKQKNFFLFGRALGAGDAGGY